MSPRFVPEVSCLGCNEPIVLHISTLARIPDNPTGLPSGFRFHPILVLCPRCKQVAKYQHANQQRQTQSILIGAEAEEVMLRCGEPDCKGVLAVNAFGSEDVYKAGITAWTFGQGVQCSNGHPVRHPPILLPKRPRVS